MVLVVQLLLASFFIQSLIAQTNGLFSVPAPLSCANKQRGFFVETDRGENNGLRKEPLLLMMNIAWLLSKSSPPQ